VIAIPHSMMLIGSTNLHGDEGKCDMHAEG